ncbi:MAG: hypothetical protein ABWY16_18860 [Pedobacter sp.]
MNFKESSSCEKAIICPAYSWRTILYAPELALPESRIRNYPDWILNTNLLGK